MALFYYEKDAVQREKQRKVLVNETIPYYMERLNNMAKKNKGHLAVGRVRYDEFPGDFKSNSFVLVNLG